MSNRHYAARRGVGAHAALTSVSCPRRLVARPVAFKEEGRLSVPPGAGGPAELDGVSRQAALGHSARRILVPIGPF